MVNLSPLAQKFILHFGEMGSRWGINRTVGQIYALLYVSNRPLNADEIAEHLEFSRSNVSMASMKIPFAAAAMAGVIVLVLGKFPVEIGSWNGLKRVLVPTVAGMATYAIVVALSGRSPWRGPRDE